MIRNRHYTLRDLYWPRRSPAKMPPRASTESRSCPRGSFEEKCAWMRKRQAEKKLARKSKAA